jgi:ketosteroid isomerase-like protein
MDAIEELVARDQIRQLAERYALAVDGKDLDGIAVLFAEDVTTRRQGRSSRGRW